MEGLRGSMALWREPRARKAKKGVDMSLRPVVDGR